MEKDKFYASYFIIVSDYMKKCIEEAEQERKEIHEVLIEIDSTKKEFTLEEFKEKLGFPPTKEI